MVRGEGERREPFAAHAGTRRAIRSVARPDGRLRELFDLVEAHLGRLLVPECCCSHALSRDEEALVGLLRYAPEAGIPLATATIPHGLPGAIRWATFAVTRALGATFGADGALGEVEWRVMASASCPFGSAPEKSAAPVLTLAS